MIEIESSAFLSEADVKQALTEYLINHKGIDISPDDSVVDLKLVNGNAIERLHYTGIKYTWRYKPGKTNQLTMKGR